MLNKLIITVALAAILLAKPFPLAAQDATPKALPDNVPGLLVAANKSFIAEDYPTFLAVMESLTEKRPNNSEYMYQLVIAYALLDEKSMAYSTMLAMQQQGLSYDFSLTDSTLNIRDTQVYEYVNDLMKLAGDPMGESEPVFSLPASIATPETIRWDESRQKFLIGTMSEGSILAVGTDGKVKELLKANDENGLWAIFDIIVDQVNNRLWVSSAAVPGFSRFDPIDKGRSALFEFDLKTLELIHRYPVPVDGQSHVLGSMVLGANGDIYIADRALPFVYLKPAGEQKLKASMVLQEMISMRGVAMQPDGRIMYVADREMGIMIVDVKAKRAGPLKIPETLNLGGIDGMYLKDNRLFVIQNGIKPQRVMRLQLNSSGTEVTSVRPLAIAQPEFDYPNYGTIHGEDLYYFANSHWSGKSESQKPVTVLRTSLDANEELISAEARLYLEEEAKKKRKAAMEAEQN